MNLFFEESGEFKTGGILNQVGEAFQVELPGGKRTKVRAKDVLFQFSSHEPAELISEASQVSEEIDLDFLWEVAGENEFGYQDLGKEYFGHVRNLKKPLACCSGCIRHRSIFTKKERAVIRRRLKNPCRPPWLDLKKTAAGDYSATIR